MSSINTAYFASLTLQIQRMKPGGCSEFQSLVTKAFAAIQSQLDGIGAEADALKGSAQGVVTAYAALAAGTDPPSLAQVLAFGSALFSAFTQASAFETLVAKIAALTSSVESLTSAIETQASLTGCSVSIPTISYPSPGSFPTI